MKKILLTVLITVLSHLTIKAQKEFVSGYVINNTGDTINGQIDNQKWVYSPLKITFKKDEQEISYELSDIQGFAINNEVTYVRKKISLDITPHNSRELLESTDRVLIDTTLLLKQLVKGRLSLYYLRDKTNKTHFFTEKFNTSIQELVDHHFLKIVNSHTYIMHSDLYNEQLQNLCEDCSNYSGLTFKYRYQESALTPLILKYNLFFGDNKALEVSKKEKFKSTFFLRAALGTYSSKVTTFSTDEKQSGLKSASLGVGSLFELPSKRRRLGLRLDLLYNYYEADPKLRSTYEVPRNTSYLAVYVGPQYSIYKNVPKKTDIYVNALFTLEKRLAEKSIDALYKDLSLPMGYQIGAGVKYNKVNIELSYTKTDAGIRPFVYIFGNIQKVSLALSYALGKNK